MNFFSIESELLRIGDYSMSYIEFFGTAAGVIAVWLSAKANKWGWPIGIINIVLFFFLFFQVQLYPDMLLQVFFFVTNLMGWWRWTHPKPTESDHKKELKVSLMSPGIWVLVLLIGTIGTFAMGYSAERVHHWLPAIFSQQSAFPYLDSFVTVMSVLATFMMIHKKIECWIVWIGVDTVAAGMYFAKDIKLVGVEYIVFSIIALFGLWNWIKTYKSYG